eukprot:GHVU01170921.1.p1 GENE.GHVU01170921.1~~GHVU01170921.1.p1  ORF type:complete len:177 (+),score=30.82 GHVU01170921.1:1217-1747(+)
MTEGQASEKPEAGQPMVIDLNTLTLQEVAKMKNHVDVEVQSLQQHHIALTSAKSRYGTATTAVKRMTPNKDGAEEGKDKEKGPALLVPLTSSVYVPGYASTKDQVLVDVGAGYHIQMSSEASVAHCKRRMELTQRKLEDADSALKEKRQLQETIHKAFMRKLQEAQAQAQAQAQSK